jgi:hypothetical protein
LKYATLTWEDTTTLAEYKSRKNLEINAARLTANRTAFTFGDKRVACDELSRSDIDGANGIISLTGELPVGWLGAWKAMDNTYISIPDVATWKSFYAAMIAQGTANFVKSQTLKTQLTAATTTAEVNSIVW